MSGMSMARDPSWPGPNAYPKWVPFQPSFRFPNMNTSPSKGSIVPKPVFQLKTDDLCQAKVLPSTRKIWKAPVAVVIRYLGQIHGQSANIYGCLSVHHYWANGETSTWMEAISSYVHLIFSFPIAESCWILRHTPHSRSIAYCRYANSCQVLKPTSAVHDV